jgi:predicted nucleic acid-binding protein
MNKILVDTNILIYAYSSTELNKKRISLDVLSENNVLLSTQVINEFIWVIV